MIVDCEVVYLIRYHITKFMHSQLKLLNFNCNSTQNSWISYFSYL